MKISQEYDSTQDTKQHIANVRENICIVAQILLYRSLIHDESKLVSPEKEVFDRVTPKLNEITYGSDEYKAVLDDMEMALKHHYEHNPHHPEHYESGIREMDLLDIVEMFCDWKAASMRHADGSLEESIKINSQRFDLGEQLTAIFENTRRNLSW